MSSFEDYCQKVLSVDYRTLGISEEELSAITGASTVYDQLLSEAAALVGSSAERVGQLMSQDLDNQSRIANELFGRPSGLDGYIDDTNTKFETYCREMLGVNCQTLGLSSEEIAVLSGAQVASTLEINQLMANTAADCGVDIGGLDRLILQQFDTHSTVLGNTVESITQSLGIGATSIAKEIWSNSEFVSNMLLSTIGGAHADTFSQVYGKYTEWARGALGIDENLIESSSTAYDLANELFSSLDNEGEWAELANLVSSFDFSELGEGDEDCRDFSAERVIRDISREDIGRKNWWQSLSEKEKRIIAFLFLTIVSSLLQCVVADGYDYLTEGSEERTDDALDECVVIGDKLRVRASPSMRGRVIDYLAVGSSISCLSLTDGWMEVRYSKNGEYIRGWVFKEYTSYKG